MGVNKLRKIYNLLQTSLVRDTQSPVKIKASKNGKYYVVPNQCSVFGANEIFKAKAKKPKEFKLD